MNKAAQLVSVRRDFDSHIYRPLHFSIRSIINTARGCAQETDTSVTGVAQLAAQPVKCGFVWPHRVSQVFQIWNFNFISAQIILNRVGHSFSPVTKDHNPYCWFTLMFNQVRAIKIYHLCNFFLRWFVRVSVPNVFARVTPSAITCQTGSLWFRFGCFANRFWFGWGAVRFGRVSLGLFRLCRGWWNKNFIINLKFIQFF